MQNSLSQTQHMVELAQNQFQLKLNEIISCLQMHEEVLAGGGSHARAGLGGCFGHIYEQ